MNWSEILLQKERAPIEYKLKRSSKLKALEICPHKEGLWSFDRAQKNIATVEDLGPRIFGEAKWDYDKAIVDIQKLHAKWDDYNEETKRKSGVGIDEFRRQVAPRGGYETITEDWIRTDLHNNYNPIIATPRLMNRGADTLLECNHFKPRIPKVRLNGNSNPYLRDSEQQRFESARKIRKLPPIIQTARERKKSMLSPDDALKTERTAKRGRFETMHDGRFSQNSSPFYDTIRTTPKLKQIKEYKHTVTESNKMRDKVDRETQHMRMHIGEKIWTNHNPAFVASKRHREVTVGHEDYGPKVLPPGEYDTTHHKMCSDEMKYHRAKVHAKHMLGHRGSAIAQQSGVVPSKLHGR